MQKGAERWQSGRVAEWMMMMVGVGVGVGRWESGYCSSLSWGGVGRRIGGGWVDTSKIE